MSGNANTDILIAGAFAAFTVDLLVYPLDTLKTRIQSPDYRKRYVVGSQTVNFRLLFRGLYQGAGSIILATLPSSGAFFTTYEGAKHVLSQRTPLPTPLAHSAASALAELVACAILTPAEVIKQNAQMVSRSSAAASATTQTLKKFRNNPLALWRGYGALAGRNLPFTAMQFPMFERLRDNLSEWRARSMGYRKKQDISLLETGLINALAAGSSGSLAAVITTPIDVVKTRIMLAAGTSSAPVQAALQTAKDGVAAVTGSEAPKPAAPEPANKTLSSWSTAKDIVGKEGWKAIWRGGALRAVWTFVGSGLYLGVYESGRLYLERRSGRGHEP